MSKEIMEKIEKYKKCKQMLAEERTKCTVYADELAKMELNWKEQVKLIDALHHHYIQDYKVQLTERELKIQEMTSDLNIFIGEKDRMETKIQEIEQRFENQEERVLEGHSCRGSPHGLHCINPYSEESGILASEPNVLPVLKFGNPYVTHETRDGADGAFYQDAIQGAPARTPSRGQEDNVVCSQPARILSWPDGLEYPEDSSDDEENLPATRDPQSIFLHEHGTGFCFDYGFDVHKKSSFCDVMFPPNYDESKREEHVQSHWRVGPMRSEQFPPDINQEAFEKHVPTHFESNVLNYE